MQRSSPDVWSACGRATDSTWQEACPEDTPRDRVRRDRVASVTVPEPFPLLVAVALAAGWLAGWFAARVTALILVADGVQPPSANVWLPDPFVQGPSAVVWLLALLAHGATWQFLAAGVTAVPLIQIAVTDLRYRVAYEWVAFAGLGVALMLSPAVHQSSAWEGGFGALAGYALFFGFQLLGRLLYRGQEALARGDLWIAAVVGAAGGPHWPATLVGGVLLSGLFAFGVLLAKRSGRAYMPYGPGLCLAGVIAVIAA